MALLLTACGPHADVGVSKVEARGEDCVSCHVDEWSATTFPVHASLSFGPECGDCHVQAAWSPARGFSHTEAFPLTLGHAEPTCRACHVTKGFAKGAVQNSCVACHASEAASVTDPVHTGLSTSCSTCHQTKAFKPATFIHAWPLAGVHATQACGSCHTRNVARYEETSPDCIGCHADDRAGADQRVAGHAAYPRRCESCHGFDAFRPTSGPSAKE